MSRALLGLCILILFLTNCFFSSSLILLLVLFSLLFSNSVLSYFFCNLSVFNNFVSFSHIIFYQFIFYYNYFFCYYDYDLLLLLAS